jgi:pimeloyl-ACP methyl ester carboxylesterase
LNDLKKGKPANTSTYAGNHKAKTPTEVVRRSIQGIPLLERFTGDEELIILICHGLGSSKGSPTAQRIDTAALQNGFGSCRFDFSGHGDHPSVGRPFSVAACLADLATVDAYIKEKAPQSEVAIFASSFGAFMTLLYLSQITLNGEANKPLRRACLRCAAVSLPTLFLEKTPPEQREELRQPGFFMLDYGYVHPLMMTKKFYDELEAIDLFRLYRPGTAELFMIHGEADEIAPYENARRFAAYADAGLLTLPGCGHAFDHPGEMEQMTAASMDFFIRNCN